MSRYNDNNPQHRKELMEYLTRPKADSKGAFRTFVKDQKINPFEQKIVNKTNELSEDKITTIHLMVDLTLLTMKQEK